ncbi:MAG: 16S rRNA (guanine(966)-N(2))-methyltransferase RsmD [Clostridia bacterium]|nr:16S rRNA (guanine(966)-N(2))-methyltransferase RsmD [Clostridia bacterium]
MRIISGTMRGMKLNTLDGLNTRPTLDRVKEALFSKLASQIGEETIVLDLFSGSGALGLESLSRGAAKAVLCDKDYNAFKVIQQNVEKARVIDKTELLHTDYLKALDSLAEKEYKFDIAFLDPPYKTDYACDAAQRIVTLKLLNTDGIIVIETDERERVINELDNNLLDIYDEKKYGRVYLLFVKEKKHI